MWVTYRTFCLMHEIKRKNCKYEKNINEKPKGESFRSPQPTTRYLNMKPESVNHIHCFLYPPKSKQTGSTQPTSSLTLKTPCESQRHLEKPRFIDVLAVFSLTSSTMPCGRLMCWHWQFNCISGGLTAAPTTGQLTPSSTEKQNS